jgi:hypothetical protein
VFNIQDAVKMDWRIHGGRLHNEDGKPISEVSGVENKSHVRGHWVSPKIKVGVKLGVVGGKGPFGWIWKGNGGHGGQVHNNNLVNGNSHPQTSHIHHQPNQLTTQHHPNHQTQSLSALEMNSAQGSNKQHPITVTSSTSNPLHLTNSIRFSSIPMMHPSPENKQPNLLYNPQGTSEIGYNQELRDPHSAYSHAYPTSNSVNQNQFYQIPQIQERSNSQNMDTIFDPLTGSLYPIYYHVNPNKKHLAYTHPQQHQENHTQTKAESQVTSSSDSVLPFTTLPSSVPMLMPHHHHNYHYQYAAGNFNEGYENNLRNIKQSSEMFQPSFTVQSNERHSLLSKDLKPTKTIRKCKACDRKKKIEAAQSEIILKILRNTEGTDENDRIIRALELVLAIAKASQSPKSVRSNQQLSDE